MDSIEKELSDLLQQHGIDMNLFKDSSIHQSSFLEVAPDFRESQPQPIVTSSWQPERLPLFPVNPDMLPLVGQKAVTQSLDRGSVLGSTRKNRTVRAQEQDSQWLNKRELSGISIREEPPSNHSAPTDDAIARSSTASKEDTSFLSDWTSDIIVKGMHAQTHQEKVEDEDEWSSDGLVGKVQANALTSKASPIPTYLNSSLHLPSHTAQEQDQIMTKSVESLRFSSDLPLPIPRPSTPQSLRSRTRGDLSEITDVGIDQRSSEESIQSQRKLKAAAYFPQAHTSQSLPDAGVFNLPNIQQDTDLGDEIAADPALVTQLQAMGFPKSQAEAALRSAFNNADLAAEFLMTGKRAGETKQSGSFQAEASGIHLPMRTQDFMGSGSRSSVSGSGKASTISSTENGANKPQDYSAVDPEVLSLADGLRNTHEQMIAQVIDTIVGMKLQLLHQHESVICQSSGVHEQQLEQQKRIEEKLREKISELTHEIHISRELHDKTKYRIGVFQFKQALKFTTPVSLSKVLAELRNYALRSKKKKHMQRLANMHFMKLILRNVFSSWRGITYKLRKEKIQEKHEIQLNKVTRDIIGRYEQEFHRLAAEINLAKDQAQQEQKARRKLEEDFRRAILKGITTMNMEAINIFGKNSTGMPEQDIQFKSKDGCYRDSQTERSNSMKR